MSEEDIIMLARIRKAQEEEEGFTLIELLVVIIIIGILAAIAIPVFLSQRKKGFDAGAKADLRNVGTLEETYLTDNSVYATALSSLTDYKRTNGVLVAIKVSTDGQSFCLSSYNTKAISTAPTVGDTPGAADVYMYDSTSGGAAATSCTVTTGSWSAWS
ncbi:MAG: prepilin-type N-terminal cleavage/methylation domain-containing protein [Actinomycetes bacterium]